MNTSVQSPVRQSNVDSVNEPPPQSAEQNENVKVLKGISQRESDLSSKQTELRQLETKLRKKENELKLKQAKFKD